MPKAQVNDLQINYELHGDGFPLVMINQFGGHIDTWDPCYIRELSKRFKLVLFDNRGTGRTDLSDKEYSIKLFADDTAGLMDACGIPRAHVLGLSMGGMIAQELVLNYPERVEKLVLCSTSCGGAKSVQPSMDVIQVLMIDINQFSPEEIARRTTPILFTEDFIKNNSDFVENHIQQMLRFPPSKEVVMRRFNALMNLDTYERLSQIRAPTLVLHGKKDILCPPENGSILAEAIPNAKLVYLENSAHMLAEEMNELLQALMDFLVES